MTTEVNPSKGKTDPLDIPAGEIPGYYFWAYSTLVIVALFIVGWLFTRDYLPLGVWDVFRWGSSISAGVKASWLFFLCMAVITVRASRRFVRDPDNEYWDWSPCYTLVKGAWVSLNSGFFEEIIYRWFTFFAGMSWMYWLNGVAQGHVESIFTQWVNPFMNLISIGNLEEQLLHRSWLVGAGMFVATCVFVLMHRYKNWRNNLIVWLSGFFLFWVVVTYGLVAAIVVHILCDIMTYAIRAFYTLYLNDPKLA